MIAEAFITILFYIAVLAVVTVAAVMLVAWLAFFLVRAAALVVAIIECILHR